MMGLSLGLGLNAMRAMGGGGAAPVTPADYVITNDAEWSAVFANDAATLSGKIAEVRGALGAVAITGKAMTTPLTIRGGSGGSIRRLDFSGTVNRVTFQDMPFQMTGWPRVNPEIVFFGNGTFDNLLWSGGSFRHGYGAGLVSLDPEAQYPEYTRVDNVRTATTSSVTTALSWQDAARTGGFIEFFNRGAATVYFAVGGAGVTATTGSTSVAPGARVRTSTLNPTTDTHIAVLSASGTSEINARTEIGMAEYLANCFAASGAANMGRIEFRGVQVRDVNNGIKGVGRPTLGIVMDCDFDRVYQDIIAVPPAVGGAAYIHRNLTCVPMARSGIAENLNGDARDPHGDMVQSFGTGGGAIGPIYAAGNRQRRGPLRSGVTSQGFFLSDNDNSPSYNGIYLVSNTLTGGATNGINSGEPSFEVGDFLIYGATILDPTDIAGGAASVRLNTLSAGRVSAQSVVAQNFTEEGAGFVLDNSFQINAAASPAALFPNIADLTSASTRAQIEAALTTAAEATGLGGVATSSAVDWSTPDHASVILWANVPSGVAWEDLTGQAIGTTITLPLRKVLNRRTGQAIVPGAGVEWRSTASDGATEVQAWTSSSGTVEPDQWVQIRKSSSASGLTAVDFDVTINGFLQRTSVTTQAAAPAVFHTQSGTGPYFRDPANAVPASTTRMEWFANIYPTSLPGSIGLVFSQESSGCDLQAVSNGDWRVTVENGAGTAVVSAQSVVGGIILNQWQTIGFDVDQVAGTAILTRNGVTIGSWTWTPAGNNFFQTTREIAFFGSTGGASLLPSGWQIEFAECYFTTSGVRSLRKRVAGNAATVNADAWKLGSNAT